MKYFLFAFFSILSNVAYCQKSKSYAAIDARARSIGYLPLEQLTKKLTEPYTKEEDKMRSVFTWIAWHISYDQEEFEHRDSLRYDRYKYAFVHDQAVFDSLWNNEYAAFVMKNHRGICGEYAALFKVMCDMAHLKCEIVEGYAKWYEFIGNPYKSNHAWNAVFINDEWQLMDVTWASGGVERKHGKVNNGVDYFYYCTPPELMINNHYPDKIKWTLLDRATSRAEYEKAIYFNYEGQGKIKIESAIPKIGLLKKKVGDSVSFELTTNVRCEEIQLTINDTIENIIYEPYPIANKDIKFDTISGKNKKNTDAIFDYIEATPLDSADTNSDAAVDGYVLSQPNYFNTSNAKVAFKYYIKKKGDFLIWVYINLEPVMAYRLQVE